MKEQEELLNAVWFTEAEVNGGQNLDEEPAQKNSLFPISGSGLVWLEDKNLEGGVVATEQEENDAEILFFPAKILGGWKPSRRQDEVGGEENAILDQEWEEPAMKEPGEKSETTPFPQIFVPNIPPVVH